MKKRMTIYFNAPITLTFSLICIFALVLDYITDGLSNQLIFSTYASSYTDPMTYVRLICHIFGHGDLNHLISNLLYILLLGPMLEEKYQKKLITVIFVTAIVTGLIHNIFFGEKMLLGASGVVFAFILLAPITGNRGIPITMILVAILWIGNEVYNGLFATDDISQLTHIIGGVIGMIIGLTYRK